MFNLTSPAKAGFTRLRGRPKHIQRFDNGTVQLQEKRHRVREILKDNGATIILSWLHLAHHDGTIDQNLFDLGGRYLRLRIRVMRHQERRSLKLGCHSLTRHLGRGPSRATETGDVRAEELWSRLLPMVSAESIQTLDELLLGAIDYDLTPELLTYNKKRLNRALKSLSRWEDYI
ncbi:hypothetical protein [Candidatus Paracaedibacter symbiosus]|uniref:hypothetical protein n=1 Tax=Candidatus Paracaedibacter symbiosus TaxID=244582 RepID=UPI0005095309|nr:hypothetical protein [Candidatus Paracaedibacter symbiosus]